MRIILDPKALRGEERFWQVIREFDERGPWTADEIDAQTNAPDRSFHEYLRRLFAGGFVRIEGERAPTPPSNIPAKTYRVVISRRDAPRVDRDGKEQEEPVIELLWRTMKMVKTFTAAELVDLASTDERALNVATAGRYLRHLAQAGIVQKLHGRKSAPTYRLARNLGASAPRILRGHVVYDPNAAEPVSPATFNGEVQP